MRHARRRPDAGLARLGRVLAVASAAVVVLTLIGSTRLRSGVLAIPVTERPNGFTLLVGLALAAIGATRPRRHTDRPAPGPLSDYWTSERDWGREHYPNDPEQF